MASKTVKMCDMNGQISAEVFKMLNRDKVKLKYRPPCLYIETDIEPKELVYPEGWYYAKGSFRNKHQSTTGVYYEIPMYRTNGKKWDAKYCTLYDDEEF